MNVDEHVDDGNPCRNVRINIGNRYESIESGTKGNGSEPMSMGHSALANKICEDEIIVEYEYGVRNLNVPSLRNEK